jgi:hypothetical protein
LLLIFCFGTLVAFGSLGALGAFGIFVALGADVEFVVVEFEDEDEDEVELELNVEFDIAFDKISPILEEREDELNIFLAFFIINLSFFGETRSPTI